MACTDNVEIKCLIEEVQTLLGMGVVEHEITDQMWCNLVKIAKNDYLNYMNQWLISNQWSNIAYKNLSTNDVCLALSTRNLDAELSFANAFSKQLGLGSNHGFILKRDYIETIEGQQTYTIPAGREINEVLWITPSEVDFAIASARGYSNNFSSDGVGIGFGGNAFSQTGAYYIAPAYDVYLRGMDFGLKNKLLQSELAYKITAGENGTKILHLLSTPFGGNKVGAGKNLYKKKVWYHYYETPTQNDVDRCKATCPDVIKLPSDVPIKNIDYCDLNEPSKVYVRKLLFGHALSTLALIRSKYSGKISIPDMELTLDYGLLDSKSDKVLSEVRDEIAKWLDDIKPEKISERKAIEVENNRKVLGGAPLGINWF